MHQGTEKLNCTNSQDFVIECDDLKCQECGVTFEIKDSQTDRVISKSEIFNNEIYFPYSNFIKNFCGQYKIVAHVSNPSLPNYEPQVVLQDESLFHFCT